MIEGRHGAAAEVTSPLVEPADGTPPTFGDLLRYLWSRRVRLLVLFGCLAGAGIVGLLVWWLFGARGAHAVISLGFRGIERHEYPSGRKFGVEDLRSPKLLGRALSDVGLAPGSYDLDRVLRGVSIVPIVPLPVLERWKKQDRDGAKREEFLPTEFAIGVQSGELSDTQRVGLLYALLEQFRRDVKYEQEAERHRVAMTGVAPPAEMTARYDYWDIPLLLRLQADRLGSHLKSLVRESQNFRDPTVNLGFLEVDRELEAWRTTGLESLAATVHRERLVKDRDAMLRRLEERQANLDLDLKRVDGQIAAMTRLLTVVEQPKTVLAAQSLQREGTPLLDPGALEKLLKTDYVGPMVRQVTMLQEEAAVLAAASGRVQRELALLGAVQEQGGAVSPPAGFEDLVVRVTGEFDRIVERYLQVLDAYLDATVAAHVTLREGPYLSLPGPRPSLVAVVILFAAAVLSLMIVIGADSLRRNPRA